MKSRTDTKFYNNNSIDIVLISTQNHWLKLYRSPMPKITFKFSIKLKIYKIFNSEFTTLKHLSPLAEQL